LLTLCETTVDAYCLGFWIIGRFCKKFYRVIYRVVDPDWFNTDPDPAFLLNPDPVPDQS
jgi:hypothetical protein